MASENYEQILNDLEEQLSKRLERETRSFISLCEIADIPISAGISSVVVLLMRGVARLLSVSTISPEMAGEILAEYIRRDRNEEGNEECKS